MSAVQSIVVAVGCGVFCAIAVPGQPQSVIATALLVAIITVATW